MFLFVIIYEFFQAWGVGKELSPICNPNPTLLALFFIIISTTTTTEIFCCFSFSIDLHGETDIFKRLDWPKTHGLKFYVFTPNPFSFFYIYVICNES